MYLRNETLLKVTRTTILFTFSVAKFNFTLKLLQYQLLFDYYYFASYILLPIHEMAANSLNALRRVNTIMILRGARLMGCSSNIPINLCSNVNNLFKKSANPVNYDIARQHIHTTNRLDMFIQVEDTPNPDSLKFYPGVPVLESGTIDFQDKKKASLRSPLAKALFRINGVKSVFFAHEFITVTKEEDDKVLWNVLKPQIFSAIMIFYTMKQPILYSQPSENVFKHNAEDSEIVKQIKELIDTKIRPTIQEDGGDLEFVSYQDNIVKLRLQGACTSCPSSIVTLQSGVKNMLKFYIPEVVDVEQVRDED